MCCIAYACALASAPHFFEKLPLECAVLSHSNLILPVTALLPNGQRWETAGNHHVEHCLLDKQAPRLVAWCGLCVFWPLPERRDRMMP